MIVKTLIDKAAKVCGGKKVLAEKMGVRPPVISDWASGARKIQPDDLAAIAHIAGFNAMNFLALATLEDARGTPKEKVLQDALGESIRQLESTLLGGSSPNDHKIQCILC